MQKYFNLLLTGELFSGMVAEELTAGLNCMGARMRDCERDSIIYMEGDAVTAVNIVLEGAVQIVREDVLGNRNIIAEVEPGDLFGEAFACAALPSYPVTVRAVMPSRLLLIQFKKIITTCPNACQFHSKLIGNMLGLIARKNILLTNKISLLSQRSIEDKLLAYFARQIERAGSYTFEIPFSRNELADYLCVDRSALSRQLSRMRDGGQIDFTKNRFTVKHNGVL